MSYSRRGFLQEYDIGVEFWEAALQLGHWQVGGDDEDALALVVLAAVERGERHALEVEGQQLVQQVCPIHSPVGVAAENHIDRSVLLAAALLDFDSQVGDFQCLAHTDGVEESQVVAVDAEGAVAFLAHHAVGVAHYEHRDSLLGEAGVDDADNFARVGGVGDGLVEAHLLGVFFVRFHIVLQMLSALFIRMTSKKIFLQKLQLAI